jgi:hypothetical protein
MRTGDGFVYYSPKQSMDGDVLVRQFTAVGRVTGEDIYQVEMFPGFIPFRRDVTWQEEAAPVGIATLKSALDLTRPRNWGHQLRFGLVEITLDDFQTISDAMRWAFRARA